MLFGDQVVKDLPWTKKNSIKRFSTRLNRVVLGNIII